MWFIFLIHTHLTPNWSYFISSCTKNKWKKWGLTEMQAIENEQSNDFSGAGLWYSKIQATIRAGLCTLCFHFFFKKTSSFDWLIFCAFILYIAFIILFNLMHCLLYYCQWLHSRNCADAVLSFRMKGRIYMYWIS